MTRRFLAVAMVATTMAVVGTYLVVWKMFGKTTEFIPYLYAHVVAVANLLWLGAVPLIARRSLPLWQGLMIGMISPILGALGLPLGVLAVLKLYYICFPIGLATGYVVWRIMTSPWRRWSAAA